jgi:hypothetical protein
MSIFELPGLLYVFVATSVSLAIRIRLLLTSPP